IIIPIYMGTLDETLNEDLISYILIQVKNHSTINNDKGHGYLVSATTNLGPAYIESPETRNMTSCKRKIAEVLKDYKTDAKETRKEFIKKIRLENKEDS
ncbi:18213_t:CDS:2, partial [Racocetra fulgida]